MCVLFLRFNGGRTLGDDHLSSQLALTTICSKLKIMLTMVVFCRYRCYNMCWYASFL